MCGMSQMHQPLAGARKCQVSAASHAGAAIHTIPREPACTHKAGWSRMTGGVKGKRRRGGMDERVTHLFIGPAKRRLRGSMCSDRSGGEMSTAPWTDKS